MNNQYYGTQGGVDGYILVYSITDTSSVGDAEGHIEKVFQARVSLRTTRWQIWLR